MTISSIVLQTWIPKCTWWCYVRVLKNVWHSCFSELSLVRVEVLTLWAIKISSWTWNLWYLHCPPPTNTKRRPWTAVGGYCLYGPKYTQQTCTHAPSKRHLWSHMGSSLCRKKYMHKTQRERALIEQLMLPSCHQSCLPGDQLRHTKNTLSWSPLRIPL